MKKFLRIFFLIFLSTSLLVSGMDDMDDVLPKNRDMQQASDFVYRAMNFFYLYKANTAELTNDYFTDSNDKKDFITSFDTTESLFNYLEYARDRSSVFI